MNVSTDVVQAMEDTAYATLRWLAWYQMWFGLNRQRRLYEIHFWSADVKQLLFIASVVL